jgi:transcriptional repressor NrdR
VVPLMICPYCQANDDKVIDSRASEGGRVIRRRRQCIGCGKRFTTYERIEETPRLMVVKKDGSREPFDRAKISRGIAAACGKLPVAEDIKQRLVEEVDEEVHRTYDREVEAREIGERVARKLQDVHPVAYVRFASEYYEFKNVDEIMHELRDLAGRVRDVPNQQDLFLSEQPPDAGA